MEFDAVAAVGRSGAALSLSGIYYEDQKLTWQRQQVTFRETDLTEINSEWTEAPT